MPTESNHAIETFGGWGNDSDEFVRDLAQMELVAGHDAGGSYEWDVFYVYYHTGRDRYFYISGSGCSCNWISDGVTSLGDFRESGDNRAIAKEFKAEYGEQPYGWTQAAVESVYNDIINHKK